MYKYRCEHCNARLDPGEKCDCRDEKKIKMNQMLSLVTEDNHGQIRLKLEDMQYAGK